jgi:hypothetical protein
MEAVMKNNDVRLIFSKLLRSRLVEAVRDAGKSRGSGFYIIFYIMSWMIANADRLVSVEDTARHTGCTREQVQLVWNTLIERGGLDEDDGGSVSIEPVLEALAKAAVEVSRDHIAALISLTDDEEKDLKRRLGDSYQLCYHLAAEYKSRLIRQGKKLFISDWMLIQKAYDEHWQPSYKKQGKKGKAVEEDDEDDDDGIIEIPVDADNDEDEDWEEEDDDDEQQPVNF